MELIADLHLHSKYSRAVSPQMIVVEMARWAQKKGISLLGTGDWTHPLWLRELKESLEETGEGIYQIKNEKSRPKVDRPLDEKFKNQNYEDKKEVYFLLSTEISSIYSQGGKTRRIHNLVLAPNFETVEKINAALRNRGANLMSDGRPIIGLSAKDLASLILEIEPGCLIIPSHIWTPWYSLYGSNSGFDSISECFGGVADQIFAVETGLSSDPLMNWRIRELDNRSIVSFSDAHSPAKLGREATVFKIKNDNLKLKISYQDIASAIKQNPTTSWEVGWTIEFYPEEGKYHWTGHRNCGVKQSPQETKKLGAGCPVCGKNLTVGVMHRVEKLANRVVGEDELKRENDDFQVRWINYQKRSPYVMLVPLSEILAEVLKAGESSQVVQNEYNHLTEHFGGEFNLLLKTSLEKISQIGSEKMSQAVKKVRSGQVVIDPGFDGVFGKVSIWDEEEKKASEKQMSLF